MAKILTFQPGFAADPPFATDPDKLKAYKKELCHLTQLLLREVPSRIELLCSVLQTDA